VHLTAVGEVALINAQTDRPNERTRSARWVPLSSRGPPRRGEVYYGPLSSGRHPFLSNKKPRCNGSVRLSSFFSEHGWARLGMELVSKPSKLFFSFYMIQINKFCRFSKKKSAATTCSRGTYRENNILI